MYKAISKTEKRHEKIRGMLLKNDLVTVKEFCEALKCSEATIRNDLRHLEENGLLKRSHGGAIATGRTAVNADMGVRTAAHKEEKMEIADYVVSNILRNGQTVILDSGSTCFELAQKIIAANLELTVITNSLIIASFLSKSTHIRLYLAGGFYTHNSDSFYDDAAVSIIKSMRVDICFLSVNGISADAGFTISGNGEYTVKSAMIGSSKKSIVLADNSKIGKIGLKVICNVQKISELVCNSDDGNEEFAKLQSSGLVITFASDG